MAIFGSCCTHLAMHLMLCPHCFYNYCVSCTLYVHSLTLQYTHTLTTATVGRSTSAITPSTHSNVHYRRLVEKRRSETASLYVPTSKPISIRLMALIEREKKTGKYISPLLGCVAPSALKYFAENPDGE